MTAELVPFSAPAAPPEPLAPPPAADLLSAWLSGRKPTTVRAYESDLGHFAAWWFGPDHPPALAADALLSMRAGEANARVLDYRNAMLEKGLASATIARRLAAIRSLVKLARLTGRVEWSIEVEAPRPEPRRDMSGPDEDGMKRVVRAARRFGDGPRAKRDRALLALLFGMGLRRGEVVALDLADLDFRAGTVAVLGKGRREKAPLPLPAKVSRAVGEWVVVRGNHDGPLFHRTDRPDDSGRLTGESVRRAVARIGGAANLSKTLRPHGLRHAVITGLLAGGESVRDVMAFSRHRKVETVMRYDDALKSNAARTAERAAKALG